MSSYNKKVSFPNNNKTKSLKTINIFDVFNEEEFHEKSDQSSLPPLNEVIWGKGFKSLINGSWADECGA
tara:strand:- start:561 stop:767 length:207 start_codon:yes stop_codon:yes gene_type:complete